MHYMYSEWRNTWGHKRKKKKKFQMFWNPKRKKKKSSSFCLRTAFHYIIYQLTHKIPLFFFDYLFISLRVNVKTWPTEADHAAITYSIELLKEHIKHHLIIYRWYKSGLNTFLCSFISRILAISQFLTINMYSIYLRTLSRFLSVFDRGYSNQYSHQL